MELDDAQGCWLFRRKACRGCLSAKQTACLHTLRRLRSSSQVTRQQELFRRQSTALEEERRAILGDVGTTGLMDVFTVADLPPVDSREASLIQQAESASVRQGTDRRVMADKMRYLQERTKTLREEATYSMSPSLEAASHSDA